MKLSLNNYIREGFRNENTISRHRSICFIENSDKKKSMTKNQFITKCRFVSSFQHASIER